MIFKKQTLHEEISETLYIYEDEDTGIKYVFNGEKLVPINSNDSSVDTSALELDKYDKDELERQDKERQEQIEKELEEYENEVDKNGADSEQAQSKLEEISDLINDSATVQDLLDETDRIVRQDHRKRKKEREEAEKAAKTYGVGAGIDDFVLDLNKLIKSEVKKLRKDDWGKINKKYSRSGLIKPGTSSKRNPVIPRLAVYYDQSGSWGASDIKIGDAAISTLNTYVKKKQLIVEIYYFANTIHTDASSARAQGGTGAGAELIKHIQSTRPDNVVIMTDDDFDHWNEILNVGKVTVPGGAFLLFRRGQVSSRLVERVKGKKLTKIYSF